MGVPGSYLNEVTVNKHPTYPASIRSNLGLLYQKGLQGTACSSNLRDQDGLPKDAGNPAGKDSLLNAT